MPVTPEIIALIDPTVNELKRHQLSGDKQVALATAHILMRVISAARWTSTHELIALVRKVGVILIEAQPRQIITGNIVRHVLHIIREELDLESGDGMMSNMFSLLLTLSVSTNKKESRKPSDFRSVVIQGIRDLVDEIQNVQDGLESIAADLIHDNEILLTPTPTSDTLLHFLIKARSKRKFSVLVTESYPNDIKAAHKFAKKLSDHNIETIVIPDSTTFALMSRVGKVLLGTSAVFANGGCTANLGVANVVECAKEHRTPVLAVAGIYKLSPLYPFNRDDLVEVGNSGKVLDYDDFDLVDNVAVINNPLNDYVPPENIDIFITNIGGHAPSSIYRIVMDYYHPDDTVLTERAEETK